MTASAPQDKLIVILGPTATGKTKLAVQIAKAMKTSIVSGDSMLVYRGFDIGTAKPSEAEREGVRHALIDCLDPANESFNAADFQRLAAEEIHAANQNGAIPILAGGTGLYVKALLEGYCFNTNQEDGEYRASLENLAEKRGKAYVHKMLEEVDPATAAKLHVNDFRRVVRALEVWRLGEERISRDKRAAGLAYDACVIGLYSDRQKLYERIEKRVDTMIDAGLADEVRRLLAQGVPRDARAMQGIGYKEMAAYIGGELSLPEAIANIKKATRHFAKRQFTWYRKMPYISWLNIDAMPFDVLVEEALKIISHKFK